MFLRRSLICYGAFLMLTFLFFVTLFYDQTNDWWTYEATQPQSHPYGSIYVFFMSIIGMTRYFFADGLFLFYFYSLGSVYCCLYRVKANQQKIFSRLCAFLCIYTAVFGYWQQKTLLFGSAPGGFVGRHLGTLLSCFLDPFLISLLFSYLLVTAFILFIVPLLSEI